MYYKYKCMYKCKTYRYLLLILKYNFILNKTILKLKIMKNLVFTLSFSLIAICVNISYAQWQNTNGPNGGIVYCMAVKGDTIFAGTSGGGVFISTDNGESWTAKNNGLTSSTVLSLAINGANIFAGSESDAGIFLSTNYGENWTTVNNGLIENNVFALAISGTNTLAAPAMAGIYLSTDNGGSWNTADTGLTNSFATFYSFAISGENIFAGGYGIYISKNKGANWQHLINSPLNVEKIVINGENIFAGTEMGMFLSSNNGENWVEVSNGLIYKDVRSIAISGSNIFAGTQGGGVYFSTNNGTNWVSLNSGLTEKNVWSLAISGEYIFAGTDNGVWKYYFGPKVPICYVEFDTTSQKYNNIVWAKNLPAILDSVFVYNEVSTDEWQRIGSVSARKSNFIDSLSEPYNQSYSYKIQVIDTNGNLSETSEPQTTITLMESQNSNEYNFMWTPYLGITVPNYYLYGIKTDGKDSLIKSLPGDKTAYNYTNPYPNFVKFFVGFYTAPCSEKSNHLVKSNYVQGTEGINELNNMNEQITIYPNPVSSLLVVSYSLLGNKKAVMELFNITGGLIKTLSINSRLTQVDISDLSAGVYIVRVTNDNGVAVKRINSHISKSHFLSLNI